MREEFGYFMRCATWRWAPQREHGAVVHALRAACGDRDHVARPTSGEHVGNGQHAHVDALDTGGRDMGMNCRS